MRLKGCYFSYRHPSNNAVREAVSGWSSKDVNKPSSRPSLNSRPAPVEEADSNVFRAVSSASLNVSKSYIGMTLFSVW